MRSAAWQSHREEAKNSERDELLNHLQDRRRERAAVGDVAEAVRGHLEAIFCCLRKGVARPPVRAEPPHRTPGTMAAGARRRWDPGPARVQYSAACARAFHGACSTPLERSRAPPARPNLGATAVAARSRRHRRSRCMQRVTLRRSFGAHRDQPRYEYRLGHRPAVLLKVVVPDSAAERPVRVVVRRRAVPPPLRAGCSRRLYYSRRTHHAVVMNRLLPHRSKNVAAPRQLASPAIALT